MIDTNFQAENAFTEPNIARLKRHPKRLVFPEAEDARVVKVAARLGEERISVPILLGDRAKIQALASVEGVSLDRVVVKEPEKASDFSLLCGYFEKMERYRRMNVPHPEEVLRKPHYYAAMMVQYGMADGIIGGNSCYPAALFRALFHIIKPQPQCEVASSCMAVVDPAQPSFGQSGILFLADCAIIPEPTPEQLAMIALETGKVAEALLGRPPRIAMLSHSTRGTAGTASALRVASATQIARQKAHEAGLQMEIDGELQIDAAIVPAAAEGKGVSGLVPGHADVLVFPDLNSGNIASKFMLVTARPQMYGQLILGLTKPAAQVSRVASAETIFGVSVAVGVEAIKYRELFGSR
ncbi:MAG: phosphate acyltransferase [Verrucomicrobiota bacterium]